MRAIPGRAVTQSAAAIRCVAPGAPLRRCASSVSTAIPWRYDPSDFLFFRWSSCASSIPLPEGNHPAYVPLLTVGRDLRPYRRSSPRADARRERCTSIAMSNSRGAAFSRRRGARALRELRPSKSERAQGRPGTGWCPWSACRKKARGRTTGSAEDTRPSLRNGFNGLLRALPGDRALLPPSSADRSAHLAPASGRQDHTAWPSARASVVCCRTRVHRIPLPRS